MSLEQVEKGVAGTDRSPGGSGEGVGQRNSMCKIHVLGGNAVRTEADQVKEEKASGTFIALTDTSRG
jgi:hypothetical protein